MSNWVEKLEFKVTELQAAVNGLIEGLVKTKERLRQLEGVNGVQVSSWATTRHGGWETEGQTDAKAAAAESTDADETPSVDADETKSGEADETDENDGEAPDDDIIVV